MASLSKDEAAEHGLVFSVEGEHRYGAPDHEVWEADLTINGHALHFAGKSEEDVLEQAQRVLIQEGKIGGKDDGAAEAEPTTAQKSDVADLAAFRAQRDETDEEVRKQLDESGDGPGSPFAA